MRLKLSLFALSSLFLVSCRNDVPANVEELPSFQNEKAELMALGSYPNYYYNLANELYNSGRTSAAMEAYQNCIKTSQNQTFTEDAMLNLSVLYFQNGQDSLAYPLMDSLIARRYTWLKWYKDLEHPFSEAPNYVQRLEKIDSALALLNDPKHCVFHYSDLNNFIHAFANADKNWSAAASVFYRDYFAKASSALFFYQKFKIESSAHQFAYRVEDKKAYFRAILNNLKYLPEQESTLRGYFHQFETLYPEAIFPDVHFVVGCFNAGGTSSSYGLIIGTEMHAKTDGADLSNFSDWEKQVVRDFSNLPLITLHELVHIQQNDHYENLLGNAIYEGAADFVSALICGTHINQYVHDWANKHEEEVWTAFKAEMYGANTNKWIGNADQTKDKPADLGYYVGYKICEAYYNKQSDKTKALKDIITISNWEEFFQQSGYGQ